MEIPELNIQELSIYNLPIHNWSQSPPLALPIYPPITSQVGIPIIDMPGCVQSHRDSDENVQLTQEDEDGIITLCDSGIPTFNPIQYDASRLQMITEKKSREVPPVKSPEPPEAPEPPAPQTPEVPKTPTQEIPCPTEAQELKEPIGFVRGDQKVTDYRLVGNECIQVTEKIEVVEQIVGNLPTAGAVTATASIAVVATSSAIFAKPLADLLLRVVKPAVKKALTKVQTLLGKKPPKLSVSEIAANKYREKKGLPPLKIAKKKKG